MDAERIERANDIQGLINTMYFEVSGIVQAANVSPDEYPVSYSHSLTLEGWLRTVSLQTGMFAEIMETLATEAPNG